jgi:hypothetical protein
VQKLEDLLTIDESELRVRMNEASLTSKRKRQDTTPSKPGTRRKKRCGFPGGFIEICLTHSNLKTSG